MTPYNPERVQMRNYLIMRDAANSQVGDPIPLADDEKRVLMDLGAIDWDSDNSDEDMGGLAPSVNYYEMDEDLRDELTHAYPTFETLRRTVAMTMWLDQPQPATYTDGQALDLLMYCLSAPEWSVSFLEDIREIVGRTGRREYKGAQWASH